MLVGHASKTRRFHDHDLTSLLIHSQAASPSQTSCITASSIRLVSGNGDSNAGRVETCYHHQWAAVIDNQWDDVDASVACAELGFEKEGIT